MPLQYNLEHRAVNGNAHRRRNRGGGGGGGGGGRGGGGQGAVALTVGSAPRRNVFKYVLLFIFDNQYKSRNSGTILRGTDHTVSATTHRGPLHQRYRIGPVRRIVFEYANNLIA